MLHYNNEKKKMQLHINVIVQWQTEPHKTCTENRQAFH